MTHGKIKLDRFNEDGELVATLDIEYVHHKECKGSMYGAYPHPDEPAFVELHPIDAGVTLTPDEEERATLEALECMSAERDDAADRARDAMNDRDDFADIGGGW